MSVDYEVGIEGSTATSQCEVPVKTSSLKISELMKTHVIMSKPIYFKKEHFIYLTYQCHFQTICVSKIKR